VGYLVITEDDYWPLVSHRQLEGRCPFRKSKSKSNRWDSYTQESDQQFVEVHYDGSSRQMRFPDGYTMGVGSLRDSDCDYLSNLRSRHSHSKKPKKSREMKELQWYDGAEGDYTLAFSSRTGYADHGRDYEDSMWNSGSMQSLCDHYARRK